MLATSIAAAACVFCVLAGSSGLIYGISSRVDARRQLGLKICQTGLALGGLIWIASSVFLGDSSAAFYGLLLLIFGTAVTGVGPRETLRRTRTGAATRR